MPDRCVPTTRWTCRRGTSPLGEVRVPSNLRELLRCESGKPACANLVRELAKRGATIHLAERLVDGVTDRGRSEELPSTVEHVDVEIDRRSVYAFTHSIYMDSVGAKPVAR